MVIGVECSYIRGITWEQRRLALRAPGSRRKRVDGADVRESTFGHANDRTIHTTSLQYVEYGLSSVIST